MGIPQVRVTEILNKLEPGGIFGPCFVIYSQSILLIQVLFYEIVSNLAADLSKGQGRRAEVDSASPSYSVNSSGISDCFLSCKNKLILTKKLALLFGKNYRFVHYDLLFWNEVICFFLLKCVFLFLSKQEHASFIMSKQTIVKWQELEVGTTDNKIGKLRKYVHSKKGN